MQLEITKQTLEYQAKILEYEINKFTTKQNRKLPPQFIYELIAKIYNYSNWQSLQQALGE